MLIIDQGVLWIAGVLLTIIGFLLHQIWIQVSNHLKKVSDDIAKIKEWQSSANKCFEDIKGRLERIERIQNGER